MGKHRERDRETISSSSAVTTPPEPAVPDQQVPTEHPSALNPFYVPGSASDSTFAHDWVRQGLRIHGRHILDRYGRVCNLRGVNLSGASKSPTNHDDATFPIGHESVTFVGRPFPLSEAKEHLARLRRWGFTFIRFVITWEAVEHAGPGQYDIKYLKYVRSLLSLLPHYGMVCLIDMHQDVWSRYSGGSGAPAWTLDAVGFDIHKLESTGAAWLLGMKGGGHGEEHGIWPCGYQKLAAATMATCFWAGDTYAPKLLVENAKGQEVPVQQFLQNAFLDMFDQVAAAVAGFEAVIGFEIMNEPHRGYVNLDSLHTFDYNTDLHLSHVPTAFESFLLGAGHPTVVGQWTRSSPYPTKRTGQTLLNVDGEKAWRPDGPTQGRCLWEMHDVWGWDMQKNEGVVLRENYFSTDPQTGRKVDWYEDFYYPFVRRWAERIHHVAGSDRMLFIEPIPNELCPASWTKENQPPNMVYAPHWYDLHALFQKSFSDFTVNVQGLSRGMFLPKALYWGHAGARDNYALQIRNIVEAGYRSLGERPVIIGECGVPMDINNKEAFESDDWSWQMRMMDALMIGLERALVGFTLWNYNPDNSDALGDSWNGENFSWFSRRRGLPASLLDHEQSSPTLDNGARLLPALVRPYAAKTAGIPLKFEYEMTRGTFTYEWANPSPPGPSSGKEKHRGKGRHHDHHHHHHHHSKHHKPATVAHPPLSDHPGLRARETEIFLPSLLTLRRRILVSGLGPDDRYIYDYHRQTLFVVVKDVRTPGLRHRITVTIDPPPRRLPFEINDFWSDFGGNVFAVGIVVVSVVLYFVLTMIAS